MPRCTRSTLFAAASIALTCAHLCHAQNELHAGPLYTSAVAGQSAPQFPAVEVLTEVPPGTTPQMLVPANFTLQSDHAPPVPATAIRNLSTSNHGVAVSIAFDASGSMRGRPLNAIRQGLVKFVDDAGPHDRFAIETIADDARWDSDWDASREQARSAIANLTTRGHLTRLWDGLLDAIHHLPPTPETRRMLVISDGHDEGSSHSLEEVISAAQGAGVTVDSIGITRSNPVYLKTLEQLAQATGGAYRQAQTPDDLTQLVGNGIQHVKALPVVSFVTKDLVADGRSHAFTLIWKHGGAVTRATFNATLPAVAATLHTERAKSLPRPLIWCAVAAAGLFAILVAAFLFRRSKRKPTPAPEPVSVAARAPPPVRSETLVTPEPVPALNLPRSFVPAAPAPSPASFAAPQPVPEPEPEPAMKAAPVRAATQFAAYFPKPAEGHPAAWLIAESGDATGREVPIEQSEFWIGSLDNNHLSLSSDPTVSANHACIVYDHSVLGLWDNQSTNGTRVNGELVHDTRFLLKPGDRIRVGNSTFLLKTPEEQLP